MITATLDSPASLLDTLCPDSTDFKEDNNDLCYYQP